MSRMLLKSWAIGAFITIILFGLSILGTHTPIGILFVFLLPALMLVEVIGYALTGNWTGGENSLLFYGPMILVGSLLYGLIVFGVLRYRLHRGQKKMAQSGSPNQ
jgi:hypothetical protein